MMSLTENRIDPSRMSPEELDRLADLVVEDGRPALVGREGVRLELPEPIFHLLVHVTRMMREGRAIVLMPEDETFTTQAAANFLGMSRQFLVNVLERGEIPFHRVGAHRRIYFKDLVKFQNQREQKRRDSMNKVFNSLDTAGLYDAVLPPEDEKS
jgi:excisionase family DNA binding protein